MHLWLHTAIVVVKGGRPPNLRNVYLKLSLPVLGNQHSELSIFLFNFCFEPINVLIGCGNTFWT